MTQEELEARERAMALGPDLERPAMKAVMELLTRQAAMIAMFSGLLIQKGLLSPQEVELIARAGLGEGPGPTHQEVVKWIRREIAGFSAPTDPGRTDRRATGAGPRGPASV